MATYRRTNRSNSSRAIRPRRESRLASQRRQFSDSIGGIDEEIKQHFLALTQDQLVHIFIRYGHRYGKGALNYAKQTYPRWQSGEVLMSGSVAERLLDLVPEVLDAGTRFEWIKKLRCLYMKKGHREVLCNSLDWFQEVSPAVNSVINEARSFRFPDHIAERLNWITKGDALESQRLLQEAEIEEAKTRADFLAEEYRRIDWLLQKVKGDAEFVHIIELPQGTVKVRVSTPKWRLLRHLRGASNVEKVAGGRRPYFITCKNPRCQRLINTSHPETEDGELYCEPGSLACPACSMTFVYTTEDFFLIPIDRRVELHTTLFGSRIILYDCPHCESSLKSPINESGRNDNCPTCGRRILVPVIELD